MLGIAESVIGVTGKILDKFIEDKDLKTKLEAELNQQLVSLDPVLDTQSLMTILMALLGLGGMRTAEKWKGVARNNMQK